MPYTELLARLRDRDKSSWPAADAAFKDIRTGPDGRVLPGELVTCQQWLDDHGYTVTTRYLADLRTTAAEFPDPQSRRHDVPFRLYLEAARTRSTPKQRDKWLAQAEKEHLSVRRFSELITGRPWADSAPERLRTAMRENPQLISQALADNPTNAKAVLAEALKVPAIADAVIQDQEAHLAVLQAAGRKADRHVATTSRGVGQKNAPEPIARLLTVLNVEAVYREAQTMEKAFMDFTGDYVWRPGEEEQLVAKLTATRQAVDNCLALVSFKVPGHMS